MIANVENDKNTCRVLIIEDDDVDRIAISRGLQKNGYGFECDNAVLISEAAVLIEKNNYDIVLADMNLPDSCATETIETLRRLLPTTPLVVLSGVHDDSFALDVVRGGAQDYLSKKYIKDGNLIARTLRHAIERHELKLGLERTRDRERFLAHHDQCTALPNRALFIDRIEQAVLHGKRNSSQFFVFFIDLDRFKNVNDTIGHNAGDEVLRVVGYRMKSVLRDSDTVARFGGDEFALILQSSSDNNSMVLLAKKLISLINQDIDVGGRTCSVGASIGIACFPVDGETTEVLLRHADIAMYESKNNGRNQVQAFSQEMLERQRHSFSLEKALREALKQPSAHFTLYYQPRIELSTGNIESVEALIRWRHAELGFIPPDGFIPLAEDIGLIEAVDEWVLDQACQQIIHWRKTDSFIRIGVNISGRSLNNPYFVSGFVEPLLKKYGVSGSSLEIEVTEDVLLENAAGVHNRLSALKALGIGLVIDDFGTGFSSLSYLNELPINTLKIDGSFICDANSDSKNKTLLTAIVSLGEALNMKVVAECVETKSQREYLSKLGCDEGQGFYWEKPSENWAPKTN